MLSFITTQSACINPEFVWNGVTRLRLMEVECLVGLLFCCIIFILPIFSTVWDSCSGFENIPITSIVLRLLVVKYWIILVHEPVSFNNPIQDPIFLFRLTKSKSNLDAYVESKWRQGEVLFMEWDKKYVWCNFVASIFSTHFLAVERPVYSRGKVFLCAV